MAQALRSKFVLDMQIECFDLFEERLWVCGRIFQQIDNKGVANFYA